MRVNDKYISRVENEHPEIPCYAALKQRCDPQHCKGAVMNSINSISAWDEHRDDGAMGLNCISSNEMRR